MQGFCPSCEKETELVRIQSIEEINVKGEKIPVEMDRFKCNECGEEFDNPSPAYDPLAVAYREYRRRKGMVQPEQIRAFREKYELTQKELSDLLGFGGATLSRYENGTLQDEAHDTILRLALEPHNLLSIIEEKSYALNSTKRERLLQLLNMEFESSDILLLLRIRGINQSPNILNGYRTLDIRKVLSAVKIFSYGARVYKTKLNKLLFYADFKHFKGYSVSITGLNYAHLPLGPVPDQYELLYESLLRYDPTLQKEEDVSLDCGAEFFSCEVEPDHSALTIAELQTLLSIKEFFKSYNSKRIVEFSHDEKAYQITQKGQIISYAYSDDLRV
jgi:putative zinc finger/helix-turn-helix YgiT family protein